MNQSSSTRFNDNLNVSFMTTYVFDIATKQQEVIIVMIIDKFDCVWYQFKSKNEVILMYTSIIASVIVLYVIS